MQLPVMPPVAPMLAKSVREIPDLGHTEPKWDGFRSIVFRDGDEVELGSRNERPMTRYFPELVEAIKAGTPPRCVLDGEIIVVSATGDRLDFDALQQRIHPAASRVTLLAGQTPASFVAFDLLALDDEDLTGRPFTQRRTRLADALHEALPRARPDGVHPDPTQNRMQDRMQGRGPLGGTQIHLTPATADPDEARAWFDRFEGAGLDGVVAKPLDGVYQPGKRALFKIKHERTADCVVAGFRWHKTGDVVGSLLLGLYSGDGRLQHVGVSASFPMARRRSLLDELAPFRDIDLGGHPWGAWADQEAHAGRRMPGNVNRWNAAKDLSFVPLRPELVVEVAYDHLEGTRFRHTAQFRRWRPDRDPATCGYDQLEMPATYDLTNVLTGTGSTA